MTEICRNEETVGNESAESAVPEYLTIFALASRTGARLFAESAYASRKSEAIQLAELVWPPESGRAWLRLTVPIEARMALERLAGDFELTLVADPPTQKPAAPPGGSGVLFALDVRQGVSVPIVEEPDDEVPKILKQRLWETPTYWWGG